MLQFISTIHQHFKKAQAKKEPKKQQNITTTNIFLN